MVREFVIDLGGVKIYAEAEQEKEALLKIIAQNIRNAYTKREQEQC